MKNTYEWILFDLTGPISSWSFRSKKWKTINNKKYKELDFETIYFKPDYAEFELGKISHTQIVNNYLKRYNSTFTYDEFAEIFKRSISPVKGMKEIVSGLKKKYKLAILSNEGKEWADYKLDGSGLKIFFDKIIISSNIGIAKPNSNFFKKSLEILKTKSVSSIFVDDLEENIKAAEKLGIKSILFKNSNQLKKELKKLKI